MEGQDGVVSLHVDSSRWPKEDAGKLETTSHSFDEAHEGVVDYAGELPLQFLNALLKWLPTVCVDRCDLL